MARASIDKLEALHDLVATYYKEILGDALEEGEVLSSGTLAAINAFLKNNDITVDVVEDSPTQNLSKELKLLIMDEQEENFG